MLSSDPSWRLAQKLSVGRAPCSSCLWQSDLIVFGGSGGEIRSLDKPSQTIPPAPSSTSYQGGSIVVQNQRYLYVVFRHDSSRASIDELHVADLHQLNNWFWRGFNALFSQFWQPLSVVADQGAAVALVSDYELIFVGGYRTHVESGWFSSQKRQVPSSTVLKFDLRRKLWVNSVPDLREPRQDHQALVVGDYLYVLGGKRDSKKSLASVERLSLSTLEWEDVPPMKCPRDCFGATVLHAEERSFLVVAGGCRNGNRIKSVEYLDCQNIYDGWKSLSHLSVARSHASLGTTRSHASVMDRQILTIAGGFSGFGILPMDNAEDLRIQLEHSPSIQAYTGVNEVVPVAMPVPVDVPAASIPLAAAVLEQVPAFNPVTTNASEIAQPVFQDEDVVVPQPSAPLDLEQPLPTSLDNTCAVCMDRPKQIAFLCGHQACEQCSPLFSECHTCRTPIEGRIRLFG